MALHLSTSQWVIGRASQTSGDRESVNNVQSRGRWYGTIQEDGDDTHWHDNVPNRSSGARSGLLLAQGRLWQVPGGLAENFCFDGATRRQAVRLRLTQKMALPRPYCALSRSSSRTRHTQGIPVTEYDPLKPSSSPDVFHNILSLITSI
ncbi:hypothetical protein PDIDSM_4517 [Penicillium digitatum]|nr:hypothetical protein PDIDSM_4517 [Penicillium digitatum]